MFFAFFYFGFSLVYAVLVLVAWYWWRKPVLLPPAAPIEGKVSVIVPMRNEAERLPPLLADLLAQDMPPQHWELLVSDDASTDASVALALNALRAAPFAVRVVEAHDGAIGKKAAIQRAVRLATGDLILTTDADCRVSAAWVRTMYAHYQHQNAAILAGPVGISPANTFFHIFQLVEFASLVGVGGVSLRAGLPGMCNGANLAFSKRAFEAVGGYSGSEHIATGDDEFLMQKIAAAYPGRYCFVKQAEAIVYTAPLHSMAALVQQRKRWASKWKLHGKLSVAGMALGVFFFHALTLWAWVVALGGWAAWPVWAGLALKVLSETCFLGAVLHFFGKLSYGWSVPFIQWPHSCYVVFMGLIANFGSYAWKGRSFKV